MSFEVYCITNKVNGKLYVGVTTRGYKNRFANHIWHSRKSSGKCRALYNAMRKYGQDAFSVELIDTASSFEEMNQLERKHIARLGSLHPNGYNLTDGGDAGSFAEETRLMASKRLKGKPMGEKNRKALVKAWADPDLRKKRCAAIKEAMNRPEVRAKTSERQKGKPKSASHIESLRKARASSVICVETGMVFEAMIDAVNWIRSQGKYPKANHAKIVRALRREDYTAYGYHWRRNEG